MRLTCFLIVSSGGRVRVVKNRTSLDADELSIMVNLTVPDVFFTRPLPVVSIELPEAAVLNPSEAVAVKITAQSVADALGLEVADVEDGLNRLIDARNEIEGEL